MPIQYCLLLLTIFSISTASVNAQVNQSSNAKPTQIENPYKRTAGFGFTNPYHSNINYPTFGIPVSSGNGFFKVPSGKTSINMWRAPSGYLYPWAPKPKTFQFAFPIPILVTNQTTYIAAPAVPPLTVVINDMEKFLVKNKAESKISFEKASMLMARINIIKTEEHRKRIDGKGNFNPADEAQMRRELDSIGAEISVLLSKGI